MSGPVRVQSHRQRGKGRCAAALVPAPAAPTQPPKPSPMRGAAPHGTAPHGTAPHGTQVGPPLTHEVAVQVDLPTTSAHGDEKRATVRTV